MRGFGWIGRRMTNSVLKGYGLTSEDLKKLAPLAKQFADSQKQVQNQPQITGPPPIRGGTLISKSEETTEEGEGTDYPSSETSGISDPVLDTLYEAMEDARSKGKYNVAVDIARQIKRTQGGMTGGRPPKKDAGESLISKSVGELDITNLGPHADEISGEIVAWLKTSGLVPDQLEGTAKSTLSGVIKENPDIVKKGLDTLQNVLAKYAPRRPGSQEQAKVPGEQGFDPTKPELWAGKMGYT